MTSEGGAPKARQTREGRLRRNLLAAAGILFVVMGLIGVVVPVLPTTPFLLLATACFVRSSERLHRWLLSNRLFGEYLRRYYSGEGMSLFSKIMTLLLLWVALAGSAVLAGPRFSWWIALLLFGVGAGVTIHILRMRTRRARS